MIKILHIIPDLRKGGAERLALDICIELSRRNDVDARLVSLFDLNEFQNSSKQINHLLIPSHIQLSITGKSIISVEKLYDFIENFKPNIIHTHLFEAELIGRWNIIKDIKYFSHFHNNMHQFRNISLKTFFDKERLTDVYDKLIISRKYNICDNSFIAISQNTKFFLQDVLSIKKQNIHLIPNAINLTQFKYQQKGSIQLNEIKLISVGRTDKNKNHTFLLDVVAEIKKKGKNVSLTIVGVGEQLDQLKSKAIQLQIPVRFTGNIDAVEDELKNHTIYVHSAFTEALGLTLIEAMATGLPVITFDGGGNRDLIIEGVNGFMLKELNCETFANRIISLVEDKNLYLQISENARTFAQNFDIKKYVDTLLSIYKQSLNQ